MTAPEAGWYNDPNDAQQLRWWNGVSWSEQQRDRMPAPVPPPTPVEAPAPRIAYAPAPYVPMANRGQGGGTQFQSQPNRKERDRIVRQTNAFAYTGAVLSLVGMLINPFGILSILGIVFSSIGLARANELSGSNRITGRGTAILGLVVGIVGITFIAYRLIS